MQPRTIPQGRGPALLLDGSRTRELGIARLEESPLVDQEKLDQVARCINTIYREATIDVTYSIGKVVIAELYDGNVALWGEQGTRRLSYRKLASRGDLLLSPAALCRAVAIYVLCERIGDRGGWRHLTASHLQEVLVLDRSHQERLLRAADEEHWTVSRLRAEVIKQRPKVSRSRHLGLVQTTRRLRDFLAKHQATLEDAEAVRRADAEVALELEAIVDELRGRLRTLEQLLSSRTVDS
jgi:hypothetical protein